MTAPLNRIWPPPPRWPVPEARLPGLPMERRPSPSAARWALLQARDVMHSEMTTVDPSCPLSEVVRVLSERHIGGAPVMDASGKILGIVSTSDLMERLTGDPDALPRHGRDVDAFSFQGERLLEEDEEEVPFATRELDAEDTAADVMTPEVHWVSADADLAEIAGAMVRHGIHRVLVREDDRYVGLISTLDVLGALAG